jgi:hypothetical protein
MMVGQRPVLLGGKIPPPKKIRDAAPKYPEFPPGTVGSGMWIGEALIDARGQVTKVWPLREVQIQPPLPAFNQAIVDSILQWRFEPMMVGGVAVPICMTVTTHINWK